MLYQPPPLEAYSPLHISIDGTNLNAVEHFTYLGSVISSDAIVSKDLDNCLFKVSSSLEDCQREYGRATRSTSPQRSKFTGPSSFPPPCTVQRPGYSIENRSGYLSGFTNAACAPSLASNGKTTCRTKKCSTEACLPSIESILLQLQCAGPATSQGWKTNACL